MRKADAKTVDAGDRWVTRAPRLKHAPWKADFTVMHERESQAYFAINSRKCETVLGALNNFIPFDNHVSLFRNMMYHQFV